MGLPNRYLQQLLQDNNSDQSQDDYSNWPHTRALTLTRPPFSTESVDTTYRAPVMARPTPAPYGGTTIATSEGNLPFNPVAAPAPPPPTPGALISRPMALGVDNTPHPIIARPRGPLEQAREEIGAQPHRGVGGVLRDIALGLAQGGPFGALAGGIAGGDWRYHNKINQRANEIGQTEAYQRLIDQDNFARQQQQLAQQQQQLQFQRQAKLDDANLANINSEIAHRRALELQGAQNGARSGPKRSEQEIWGQIVAENGGKTEVDNPEWQTTASEIARENPKLTRPEIEALLYSKNNPRGKPISPTIPIRSSAQHQARYYQLLNESNTGGAGPGAGQAQSAGAPAAQGSTANQPNWMTQGAGLPPPPPPPPAADTTPAGRVGHYDNAQISALQQKINQARQKMSASQDPNERARLQAFIDKAERVAGAGAGTPTVTSRADANAQSPQSPAASQPPVVSRPQSRPAPTTPRPNPFGQATAEVAPERPSLSPQQQADAEYQQGLERINKYFSNSLEDDDAAWGREEKRYLRENIRRRYGLEPRQGFDAAVGDFYDRLFKTGSAVTDYNQPRPGDRYKLGAR